MATMTILEFPCIWTDCTARATRRILDQNGMTDGDYCARHANSRLVELAKQEGQGHYGTDKNPAIATEKVKAVKA